MCFADDVGANVVAKYHSRRRDTFNHMPNAGNATLMFHVVFTRILHTRSEAVWQTPPTDERWINRNKKRNFNEEPPSVYRRHVCPVNDKITGTQFPKGTGGCEANEGN